MMGEKGKKNPLSALWRPLVGLVETSITTNKDHLRKKIVPFSLIDRYLGEFTCEDMVVVLSFEQRHQIRSIWVIWDFSCA